MKTKRFSAFYTALLVIVVLVLVLTEIGKALLRDVLADFESTQYKYVAEEVFSTCFSDPAQLASAVLSDVSEYETQESLSAFLTPYFSEGLSYLAASTGLDEKIVYVVKSGEDRIASFSVIKTDRLSKHKFATYALEKITLNEKLLQSVTLRAPVGYAVAVNGTPVLPKNAVGDRIETASQSYMPDGVDGIFYTTYTFDRLCSVPAFDVTAPSGELASLTKKEDGALQAEIVFDRDLQEKFSSLAIEATEAYAKYMQNDASFAGIKGYFDPNSELYTNIRTSATGWVIDHNGYRFEDVEASEFYAYSDTVFSCRVSLTHILRYNGLRDYQDKVDMTWYFRKIGNEYRIYASFNNL